MLPLLSSSSLLFKEKEEEAETTTLTTTTRRRLLLTCPTIYTSEAAEVQVTGGWNVWSESCKMSSTFDVASDKEVKIKKSLLPGDYWQKQPIGFAPSDGMGSSMNRASILASSLPGTHLVEKNCREYCSADVNLVAYALQLNVGLCWCYTTDYSIAMYSNFIKFSGSMKPISAWDVSEATLQGYQRMSGELVIDRGATSGNNRHFLVKGTLELEDVTLKGGYSAGDVGGAVAISGMSASGTFTRCGFQDNTALHAGGGGAVWVGSSGSGKFTSCTWSGNSSPSDGNDFEIASTANSVTIINSESAMDLGGATDKIVACSGNSPCTDSEQICSDAVSPLVGVVCLVPCPTIYTADAAEVQATGGWNIWLKSCKMSSTKDLHSGDTVNIKKHPSKSGELVIDSSGGRHFNVYGGSVLEMEGVTLTGGYAVGWGGSVRIQSGSGIFTSVFFKDNSASSGGGAVTTSAGGSGKFISCSWSGNSDMAHYSTQGPDLYIYGTNAGSCTIINSQTTMDIDGDTTKIITCTGNNNPCTTSEQICSAAVSPLVGVVCLVPCPTIYTADAAEVQATGGWNVWSTDCKMSSTYNVQAGTTVKIKKDPTMDSKQLIIDRGGATSGSNRHFVVAGALAALEMEDVTLKGGFHTEGGGAVWIHTDGSGKFTSVSWNGNSADVSGNDLDIASHAGSVTIINSASTVDIGGATSANIINPCSSSTSSVQPCDASASSCVDAKALYSWSASSSSCLIPSTRVVDEDRCKAGSAQLGLNPVPAQLDGNLFPPGCFRCQMPACTNTGLQFNSNLDSVTGLKDGWNYLCVAAAVTPGVTCIGGLKYCAIVSVAGATCTDCSDLSTCTAISACSSNMFNDDGLAFNGCEAGCPSVAGATCISCSSSSTCTTISTCINGKFDSDSDPTNGCESNHTIPDPPKNVTLRVAGVNSLNVTIEPPENDGGAEVTHYKTITRVSGAASVLPSECMSWKLIANALESGTRTSILKSPYGLYRLANSKNVDSSATTNKMYVHDKFWDISGSESFSSITHWVTSGITEDTYPKCSLTENAWTAMWSVSAAKLCLDGGQCDHRTIVSGHCSGKGGWVMWHNAKPYGGKVCTTGADVTPCKFTGELRYIHACMSIETDVAAGGAVRKVNTPNANTVSYTTTARSCNVLGCSIDFTIASTTVPDPPKKVTLRVVGANSLKLTIEPPENDGGAEITHYNYNMVESFGQCDELLPKVGGDWELVRSLKPGATAWYQAKDRLAGTDVYGDASTELGGSWSIKFADKVPNYDQFLFLVGNCETWVVAAVESVVRQVTCSPNSCQCAETESSVLKSSASSIAYSAKWCHRNKDVDPFISTGDHTHGTTLVYGGSSYSTVSSPNWEHGVYVYIRNSKLYKRTTTALSSVLSIANIHTNPYTAARVKSCSDLGCSKEAITAIATAPDPPKKVTLRVASDNSLKVTIEFPYNDGGADITHFQVVVQPKAECGMTALECNQACVAVGGDQGNSGKKCSEQSGATFSTWKFDRPKGCWISGTQQYWWNAQTDASTLCRKTNDFRPGNTGTDYDQCRATSTLCKHSSGDFVLVSPILRFDVQKIVTVNEPVSAVTSFKGVHLIAVTATALSCSSLGCSATTTVTTTDTLPCTAPDVYKNPSDLCQLCPLGFFTKLNNQAACTPLCAAGSYVSGINCVNMTNSICPPGESYNSASSSGESMVGSR